MWGKEESTWRQDWKPSIKYRARYLSLGALLNADVSESRRRGSGNRSAVSRLYRFGGPGACVHFPQYLDIVDWQEPTGFEQISWVANEDLQKRFSKGLSFLVSYTASKTLSNAGTNCIQFRHCTTTAN